MKRRLSLAEVRERRLAARTARELRQLGTRLTIANIIAFWRGFGPRRRYAR
jgi:hypothetical protein